MEPMAIEAAVQAERRHMEARGSNSGASLELELQQARYEASLAERRYAACDPDNRLIAAQLEKSWEAALRRVEACRSGWRRCEHLNRRCTPDFTGLADDLDGRMERARRHHAHAPATAAGTDHRHHRRCRRGDARGRPDDPLAAAASTPSCGSASRKSGEHGCRTSDRPSR